VEWGLFRYWGYGDVNNAFTGQ